MIQDRSRQSIVLHEQERVVESVCRRQFSAGMLEGH
jgi:hypothetical protein